MNQLLAPVTPHQLRRLASAAIAQAQRDCETPEDDHEVHQLADAYVLEALDAREARLTARREARFAERLHAAAWRTLANHESSHAWGEAEKAARVESWVREALEARVERLEGRSQSAAHSHPTGRSWFSLNRHA